MEFGGPGGQSPVCLGGQSNRQTLSRFYNGSAEFRVPGARMGQRVRIQGLVAEAGLCRHSGLWRSCQAQGPAQQRTAMGEARTADYF